MTDAAWIVPAYPWDDDPVRGVFYGTQASALARRGLDVTVACPTPWAPWPLSAMRTRWRRYSAAPSRTRDKGVFVVRPRYPGVPGEPRWAHPDWFISQAAWRARRSWSTASLIHGHSAMTGLAAWRLARRTGLPLFLTFHGGDLNMWPDAHPEQLADLRQAVRDARAVITVSDALASRVAELFGIQAITLPLGCDHRELASRAMPRGEARTALNLVDDRSIVLFVGNLLASKGVHELADAILSGSDRFLGVFVGDGPELGYGTGRSRGGHCLRYLGARPHDEIAGYMSAADVLVLPSYREGLPTVLVEAGSVGLPVIASAVGGIPDLLGHDRGVILREISVSAISEALAAFRQDPSGAQAAADRLRRYVHAEHDVDTNAGRLLDLYQLSAMQVAGYPAVKT